MRALVQRVTRASVTSEGSLVGAIAAAKPEAAEPLVDAVVAELRALGATVSTGRFRTEMQVELVNDGPVTLMLEVDTAAGA